MTVRRSIADKELIDAVAQFRSLYDQYTRARRSYEDAHVRALSHPDAPKLPIRVLEALRTKGQKQSNGEIRREWAKQLKAHEERFECQELRERCVGRANDARTLASQIFKMRATTAQGVAAKMQVTTCVARHALYIDGVNEFYEQDVVRWTANVRRDLERLTRLA